MSEGSSIIEMRKEKKPAPRRVFLEIGTSQLPVSWIGSKKFENDIYVGIDIGDYDIKMAKDSTSSVRRPQELKNFHFMRADGTRTPLRDKSVDEVFIGNVVGLRLMNNRITREILDDAKRVLKNNGKLIIKETNTPEDLDLVKTIITDEGFEIEKIVTSNSPDWEEAIDPYENLIRIGGIGDRFRLTESYIIFAQLKK